jgi:flagellar biosynthesis protein
MKKKSGKSGIAKAVALRYKPLKGDNAPKVVAGGSGRLAEKIIELARENEIPVEKDPDLVEVLSRLDVDQEIPPDVYVAVAELLAFVYRLNRKKAPL